MLGCCYLRAAFLLELDEALLHDTWVVATSSLSAAGTTATAGIWLTESLRGMA